MAQQFCITQTHLSCYNKLLTLARYVLGQHFSIFMTSNKYSSHYLRPHEASLGVYIRMPRILLLSALTIPIMSFARIEFLRKVRRYFN